MPEQDENLPDKKYWTDELESCRKAFAAYWTRCDNIEKKYLAIDDKNDIKAVVNRRYNVLWTNQQVLRPAIFGQMPQVACKRYHSSDDQASNLAAQILGNCLTYNADSSGALDPSLFARDDLILFARGVLWVLYKQDESDEENPYECVEWSYLPYRRFMHSSGERWNDVWWTARKIMMERGKVEKKYPDKPFNFADRDNAHKKVEEIEFWQIWSKRHKKVFLYADRCDELVDVFDPPFKLDGFFPCPRPAYGTLSNSSLIPVPDFVFYEDESNDIDAMMTRVAAILEAIKTRGVYSAAFSELRDLFNQPDNGMVPVKEFDDFMAKGGLKGVMDMVPTEQLASVVKILLDMINNKLDVIYQKTGISDIQRSLSDPNETLGAQRLKANYGHIRLRDKRSEIARIVRDSFQITGEIMSELYRDDSILLASGVIIKQTPVDPQTMMPVPAEARPPLAFPECYEDQFNAALQLLRSSWLRQYKIDIDTDSTVAVDENEALQQITQMLEAIGGYMAQSMSVAQSAPPMIPVMAEGLKMLARSFRPAASLEQLLDKALEQIVQTSQTPPAAPPPSKEDIAKEALQLKAIESQGKMSIETQRLRMEEEQHRADLAIKQRTMAQKDQEIALEAAQEQRLAVKEVVDAAPRVPFR